MRPRHARRCPQRRSPPAPRPRGRLLAHARAPPPRSACALPRLRLPPEAKTRLVTRTAPSARTAARTPTAGPPSLLFPLRVPLPYKWVAASFATPTAGPAPRHTPQPSRPHPPLCARVGATMAPSTCSSVCTCPRSSNVRTKPSVRASAPTSPSRRATRATISTSLSGLAASAATTCQATVKSSANLPRGRSLGEGKRRAQRTRYERTFRV